MDFYEKRRMIEKQCRYKYRHFCDGTPNLSITSDPVARPPCPDRFNCPIKKIKVFNKESN